MADRTMTVNIDHTASLDNSYLAIQGEQITVDAVLAAGLWALGYDGYIDFIQADGLSYFKGPYDCSTGTISFTLGSLDSILDKEGKVWWQFVLATTVGSVRTTMWLSEQVESKVLPSILATTSAILPYVPQMVYPVQYPASNISVADVANHFVGNTSEDVLAEIAVKVAKIDVSITDFPRISPETDDTARFQRAIDTLQPIRFPQGEYFISDSLGLYQNTILVGDYNSALTYSKTLTKIYFTPATEKDLFKWHDAPPANTYVQGVYISGFSISGLGGNYVFNLPFTQATFISKIKVFAGFKYGVLIDGSIDTTYDDCYFGGITTIHVNVIKTNWIATTTWFEKCYFTSGAVGVLVELETTNSLNFNNCVFETLNVLADIYNNNMVNFFNPYVENIPKTNESGSMIQLGINGLKTGLVKGNVNIIGGHIRGCNAAYTTITTFNVDYFKNLNISGVTFIGFQWLLNATASLERLSLVNSYLDSLTYLLTPTTLPSQVNTSGGNFNLVKLNNIVPAEYLATPNIQSSLYMAERLASGVGRYRLFLDNIDMRLKYRDAGQNLRRISFLESATATPTLGVKLQKGEIVFNTTIGLGQPVGRVAQSFSRDTRAAIYDAVTTNGSPIITSAAGTFWDFAVNDIVRISAGFAETAIPYYRIIAKGAGSVSITVDANATGDTTGTSVLVLAHNLQKFGQQGYRTKAGAPDQTPYFIGEELLDTTNGKWYKSKSLTAGDWVALNHISFDGTLTWNPGSLADGVGETSGAITVTGAALGDFVLVSAPYDLQGMCCNGYVSAANAVKIRLQNETGGTLDLASGDWKARVIK